MLNYHSYFFPCFLKAWIKDKKIGYEFMTEPFNDKEGSLG